MQLRHKIVSYYPFYIYNHNHSCHRVNYPKRIIYLNIFCCRYDSMKSLCDRFNKAIDSMVQLVNRKIEKISIFFPCDLYSKGCILNGCHLLWGDKNIGCSYSSKVHTWSYPSNKRCCCPTVPNYNLSRGFYSVAKFKWKNQTIYRIDNGKTK